MTVNLCEGCPVDDERCPCDHDVKRCNWKATFRETGLWNNEDIEVVGIEGHLKKLDSAPKKESAESKEPRP